MKCSFSGVAVQGMVAVVPPVRINIDDEIAFFDNNPKKLARAKNMIGYGARHVVDAGVTAVDLCEQAALKLIKGMGLDPQSIDALVLVNQSPDHFHPAGACILQGRLGLSAECAAFDVAMGCSGYVYGLWLAHSLIASGAAQKLLLLAGDTPSIHTDRRNRLVNPLFGDAGSATLLTRADDGRKAFFNLATDGRRWHSIAMPAGGFRLRADADILSREYADEAGNIWKLTDGLIDGMAVFDFSTHEVPQNISGLLAYAGLKTDDIDFFALHQANKQIVQGIGLSLGLSADKIFWRTFEKYGNQSTASVAGALCDALEQSMPGSDLRLLLSGFGVGLSWGSAVIETKRAYNGGVQILESSPQAQSRVNMVEFWQNKFLKKGI